MKSNGTQEKQKIKVDKIDYQILSTLQKNAKITNAALAKQVKLSAAPTLERVKKLEKHGIIKRYLAIVDTEALGLSFEAIVLVRIINSTSYFEKKFRLVARNIPNILACHKVIGETDFVLKVIVKSVRTYEKLLSHIMDEMKGNIQTKSMTIIESVDLPKQGLNLV